MKIIYKISTAYLISKDNFKVLHLKHAKLYIPICILDLPPFILKKNDVKSQRTKERQRVRDLGKIFGSFMDYFTSQQGSKFQYITRFLKVSIYGVTFPNTMRYAI